MRNGLGLDGDRCMRDTLTRVTKKRLFRVGVIRVRICKRSALFVLPDSHDSIFLKEEIFVQLDELDELDKITLSIHGQVFEFCANLFSLIRLIRRES